MGSVYKGQLHQFEERAILSRAGGMADVYLAEEVGAPQHQVALKVPKPGFPREVSDLFLREAEAAGRVANPFVVALVDWGDSPPFIAYEYMAGGTLGREIQQRQAASEHWPISELTNLYRMLCEGMTAINQHVIHRDLKPDNIFIDGAKLRISDFGISKYVGEATRSHTFKGWGSSAYMAPESFRSESVDWRADQYSLGMIFYELATLERPFSGDDATLEHAHLYEVPPRIASKTNQVTERMASLVARMLEKRVEKRFRSWEEISAELEAIAAQEEPDPIRADDPVVRRAAEALHKARSNELETQRAADQKQAWIDMRDELLDYWADEFFSQIENRAGQLNTQLGEDAYGLERRHYNKQAGAGQRACSVSFFNGRLIVTLQPAPYENERQALGWGIIDLRTYGRSWLSNLVLLPDPLPYGTWQQIDMKISPIMREGAQPENQRGGEYEIFGNDRIVEGRNWDFLVEQWMLRTIVSVVDYSEQALKFEELLGQLFQTLTEDGPNEKPAERPRKRYPGLPEV
jgi:serine/threonine protein kinase